MTPSERQVDEELGAARPLLQAPEPQGAAASSELKQQASQVRMARWTAAWRMQLAVAHDRIVVWAVWAAGGWLPPPPVTCLFPSAPSAPSAPRK